MRSLCAWMPTLVSGPISPFSTRLPGVILEFANSIELTLKPYSLSDFGEVRTPAAFGLGHRRVCGAMVLSRSQVREKLAVARSSRAASGSESYTQQHYS